MKLHEFGPKYIEDGIMYAHVRVCLIEEDGEWRRREGETHPENGSTC